MADKHHEAIVVGTSHLLGPVLQSVAFTFEDDDLRVVKAKPFAPSIAGRRTQNVPKDRGV